MDDIVARGLRRLPASLSATLPAAALVALVACGGGGASTTSPPPGGGDPAPESAYLLAEFVARDANNQFVHVWDPARPGVAVQDVRIVESNGIAWSASRLAWADATRFDAATRTVTTLGHAKVFFDNDGKVWSIDLRGGRSHVPVQVSSVLDANGIAGAVALDEAGDDAWIDVAGVAHHWAVRATMSATEAAQSMMAFTPMRDGGTGLPQYLFVRFGGESGTAVQPTTFGVRDLAFRPVPEPTVDAMGGYDRWLAADPARPGLAYLRAGGQLRALRWNTGGAAVDAAGLHDFTVPAFSPVPATADADAVYVADGAVLLRVADGAASAIGAFNLAPAELGDAGGHVVGTEPVPTSASCCTRWEALSKAEGTVALVTTGDSTVHLVAAGDAGLLFTGAATAGQDSGAGYLLLDAAGAALRGSGGLAVGLVRAATARLDQPASVVGMLACTPDAVAALCSAGTLSEIDVATGATVGLGPVGAGGQALHGDLVVGLPGVLAGQTTLASPGGFGEDETDVRDAWQLATLGAGSLVRVTRYLP